MAGKTIAEILARTPSGPGSPAADDAALRDRCPMLHDLMTVVSLDGKRQRKVCTLTIFAADGVFKASLNERDRGLTLWASCDALAGIPDALETMLAMDPIPWRQATAQPQRGGRA
jgi:hypothetical protein